jgi:predicted RNase H-like nuclease (RuvC/YqgF family)
MKKSKN